MLEILNFMPQGTSHNSDDLLKKKHGFIESLCVNLETTALDPTFEAYGNFLLNDLYRARRGGVGEDDWVNDLSKPIYPDHPGAVRFFGNFWNLSFVFNIDTDEPALIERLTQAIRKNQQSPAYQAARQELIERSRKSRRPLTLANPVLAIA